MVILIDNSIFYTSQNLIQIVRHFTDKNNKIYKVFTICGGIS